MANTRVSAADVLSGIAAPPERTFRNRIVGLITLQRVGLCVAVLPFALGVSALFFSFFASLNTNRAF